MRTTMSFTRSTSSTNESPRRESRAGFAEGSLLQVLQDCDHERTLRHQETEEVPGELVAKIGEVGLCGKLAQI